MNKLKKEQHKKIADEIKNILEAKGYDTHQVDNLLEARDLVLSMMPHGASVALGGSETLSAMGLVDYFKTTKAYSFFDRYQSIPFSETVEIYRQSMLADFLITGTNALVNMDSSGNRVAGMIFGPKRVIVVAGVNKVVDTLEDALKRLKQIAPKNAKRVGHNVPCTETLLLQMKWDFRKRKRRAVAKYLTLQQPSFLYSYKSFHVFCNKFQGCSPKIHRSQINVRYFGYIFQCIFSSCRKHLIVQCYKLVTAF